MPNSMPSWVKLKAPDQDILEKMCRLTSDAQVFTICESAACPNVGYCFKENTATLLILGNRCSRNCTFCAVQKENGAPPEPEEPERVARFIKKLNLKYVVITSVTRDDLEDGGAEHYVKVINKVKELNLGTKVEVLLPDFLGKEYAYDLIISSSPSVYGHNIETVKRLYPFVRKEADYDRSLNMLSYLKNNSNEITKSSILLGMGETMQEVLETLRDLRNVQCDIVMIGQYLQPSTEQLSVKRFVPPEDFNYLGEQARAMGFCVAAGTFVRTSYKARLIYEQLCAAGSTGKREA